MFGCGTANSPSNSTDITSSLTAPVEVTRTRLPTATRRPSSIPLLTKTPDLTTTATYQENATAWSAEQTKIAQYPRICKSTNSYVPPKYSPDALWLEEFCFSADDKTPILVLSNKETQVLWKLFYRDFIVNMNDGNGIGVVHWSLDKTTAYFTSFPTLDVRICSIGTNSQYFGKGLFRIDLNTGTIATILPLREDARNYGFSFSPTGRRLIYQVHTSDLIILDIQTGESVSVDPVGKYQFGGGYLWSSNGIELIYSTVLYNENFEPISYSLRLVDAQTGIERILLDSSKNCLIARSWSDNNILTIESEDENNDSTFIEYDLNSNTIILESTATP